MSLCKLDMQKVCRLLTISYMPYVLMGNRNVQSLYKDAFKNLDGVVESLRADPL